MKISKKIGILCCCFIITSSCLDGNKENTRLKKSSDDSNTANKTNSPKLDKTRIDIDKVKQEIGWSDDVRLKFLSDCLKPFLEAKKVTTNCSNCNKISFSYTLTTNEKGEVIKVNRESEIIHCKQLTSNDIAELHAVIESYFKKQILPGLFANGNYTGQLGFILRC